MYRAFPVRSKPTVPRCLPLIITPPHADATDQDHKRRILPIQLRVINALKKWVEDFFDDFDEQLATNLKDFLAFTVEIDHPKHSRTLAATIDAKLAARMTAGG